MMALPEGTRVFVCYDLPPPELYHERYVLAACACGMGYHIILTPDFETYAEQISVENDDLASFRVAAGGQLPAGLTDANTYRFRRMPSPEMMVQYRRDALQAAAAMAVAPGMAVGGMAAPIQAQAAAPAAAAGADEVWVRVETKGDKIRGEIVEVDGTEIVHGKLAFKYENGEPVVIRRMARESVDKYKGAEAIGDACLLGINFQGVTRAERQWRDVSKETQEEKFEDWGVPGPRTAQWCVRFLNRRNGGPQDHHRWWVQSHSLKPDAWGVAEHDHLMKALDKLGRYDGLDLANIAGVEMMFRRVQLIEYIYSERGPGKGASKGDGGKKEDKMNSIQQYESTIFAGSHKEFGDVMVAPSLLEYVAKEVESEAAVMKQVRKAREERAAVQK